MRVMAMPALDVDCPVHGRVKAVYRTECFWWECPQMVDCGFTVTKEQVIHHPDGGQP